MRNESLNEELKIWNVAQEWEKIKKTPVSINLEDLKDIDGAGAQMLIFLFENQKKNPELISLYGCPSEIKKKLKNIGYKVQDLNGEEL